MLGMRKPKGWQPSKGGAETVGQGIMKDLTHTHTQI